TRLLETVAGSREPLLLHVAFERCAQSGRGFSFAADSDGKMTAAGEDPDITFKLRQKLDIDAFPVARNVVAQSAHGVARGERGSKTGPGTASTRRGEAIIRI